MRDQIFNSIAVDGSLTPNQTVAATDAVMALLAEQPKVVVTIERDDWRKSLEVILGSWSDLDPGEVHTLVRL